MKLSNRAALVTNDMCPFSLIETYWPRTGRHENLVPRPPRSQALELAEKLSSEGHGLSKEAWADQQDCYVGECYKECYEPQVLIKGSVYEFGVYGVYVCSGCGYAYPPECEPAEWNETKERAVMENERSDGDPDQTAHAIAQFEETKWLQEKVRKYCG
jgi:hypothetical protein